MNKDVTQDKDIMFKNHIFNFIKILEDNKDEKNITYHFEEKHIEALKRIFQDTINIQLELQYEHLNSIIKNLSNIILLVALNIAHKKNIDLDLTIELGNLYSNSMLLF